MLTDEDIVASLCSLCYCNGSLVNHIQADRPAFLSLANPYSLPPHSGLTLLRSGASN
jgi:hypothetical protein